jgi:hypothetical protein
VWKFTSDLKGRTLIYKRVQRRNNGRLEKLHNNEIHNNLYSSPNRIK